MSAEPLDPPVSPLCAPCAAGEHHRCQITIPTGQRVPDMDPYRDRDRLLAVYVVCGCPCREG
jgi:hypothetical protein